MLRPFFPELVMSTDLLSFEHPSVLLFCLTGRKISTSSTKFVFFMPIWKTKWPSWPIHQKGGTLYSGARYVAFWTSCILFLSICKYCIKAISDGSSIEIQGAQIKRKLQNQKFLSRSGIRTYIRQILGQMPYPVNCGTNRELVIQSYSKWVNSPSYECILKGKRNVYSLWMLFVNRLNHTSWVAIVTPTDRPKSVRNRCVIKVLEAFSVCHFAFWIFLSVKGLLS